MKMAFGYDTPLDRLIVGTPPRRRAQVLRALVKDALRALPGRADDLAVAVINDASPSRLPGQVARVYIEIDAALERYLDGQDVERAQDRATAIRLLLERHLAYEPIATGARVVSQGHSDAAVGVALQRAEPRMAGIGKGHAAAVMEEIGV